MHVADNNLFVSFDTKMHEDDAEKCGCEILERIQSDTIKGVVIDLSGVMVIDSCIFKILRKISKMVSVMGVQVVFIGIQAGVASSLIELEVDCDDINTAVCMEDGLEVLNANGICND